MKNYGVISICVCLWLIGIALLTMTVSAANLDRFGFVIGMIYGWVVTPLLMFKLYPWLMRVNG